MKVRNRRNLDREALCVGYVPMQCVHFVVRHCSDEVQYAVYGEEVATGVEEETSVGVGCGEYEKRLKGGDIWDRSIFAWYLGPPCRWPRPGYPINFYPSL